MSYPWASILFLSRKPLLGTIETLSAGQQTKSYKMNLLKPISEEESRQLNFKKAELLEFLSDNGIQYVPENMSKPYSGTLSPGCTICADGTWSCVYITSLCDASCFFCPQDRNQPVGHNPRVDDHLYFESPHDYVAYLQKYNFKGIAFTGGEPLIVFDRVVNYIRTIRASFGQKHYLWLYTNGNGITEKRLGSLKEAGLDELRFDLSARGYESSAPEMALDFFDTVTIEIPAIPEDVQLVKDKLETWQTLGFKHLNLHQLMVTEHNGQAFRERGYSIVHQDQYKSYFPVIESELAALEIMQYAVDTDSPLSINYCSRCYKERHQRKAFRSRYVSMLITNGEEITATNHIRRIEIAGSDNPISAKQLLETVAATPCPTVCISYDEVETQPAKGCENTTIARFGDSCVAVSRRNVFKYTANNKREVLMFYHLFVEMLDLAEAEEAVKGTIEEIKSFYGQFSNVEYMPKGLPDYK